MMANFSPKDESMAVKQVILLSINSSPLLKGFKAALPEVLTSISQGFKLVKFNASFLFSACSLKTGTTSCSIASAKS